ncbi:hypothetical protein HYC85_015853 [Camellia sinensis]|uniref:NB-ARC domain-containing protein n=1 Tax=Camellia sinensis TaxID=4442 RepID=A0A7J7GZA4_CAMSI|nr:hypothetical protein HYC85_015853 [Camellia sinensis]
MGDAAIDSLLENLKWIMANYDLRPEIDLLNKVYERIKGLEIVLEHKGKFCLLYRNISLHERFEDVALRMEVVGSRLSHWCQPMPLVAHADIRHSNLADFTHVIEEIKQIVVVVTEVYNNLCNPRHAKSYHRPKAFDNFLNNLYHLIVKCKACFIYDEMDQPNSLCKLLQIMRSLLKGMLMTRYQHDQVQYLVKRIGVMASELESVVSNQAHMENSSYFQMHVFFSKINGVMEEIKAVMEGLIEIYDKMHDIEVLQGGKSSDTSGSSRTKTTVVEDEFVVGFDDEAMTIKERLTGRMKQLEVVSIIGMPGLGKTTLARKVYNDPYIAHYFHLRAWTYVSQSHTKKEMLLDILHSLMNLTDEIKAMNDEYLGERLYKRLKGNRYFIVMDDIWNIGAWDDIRVYLPNDSNGSKVLFTSRTMAVALRAKPDGHPHCLRFLTEEESWELLHEKVFRNENFPPELMEFGEQIMKKCEGLPLAIVVIAGLLAKSEKTKDRWKHVAASVRSCISSDPNQYMNTLALSYDNLPQHLKPCFLYLGAFRDDHEIPVWKLILLWIAEGFIHPIGQRRLEDIGEGYLMDLIDRSLVIVSRKKSNGGIKACRIHDLLRDLCLKKSEEFNFLKRSHENKLVSSSSSSNGSNNQLRLCIHSDCLNFDGVSKIDPNVPVTESFNPDDLNFDCISLEPSCPVARSFLCFGNSDGTPLHVDPTFYASDSKTSVSSERMRYLSEVFHDRDALKEREKLLFRSKCLLFVDGYSFLKGRDPSLWYSIFVDNCFDSNPRDESLLQTFILLQVLDLSCRNVFFFREILHLVYLRYLAIQTDDFYVLPPSISNLSNLETLILGTQSSHVIMPHVVSKMAKLRHLYCKGGVYHIDFDCPKEVPLVDDSYPFVLKNLETISYMCPCGAVQDLLSRTPNLRKLGFRGHLISMSGDLELPDLRCLIHLETLKLDNRAPVQSSALQLDGVCLSNAQLVLPTNLKSLTLRGTRIKWEEMWIIGLLHNLEVLKLEINACQGPEWETTDGGFHQLKFLKFKLLSVERWITSSTHFPSLQHLVFENCVLLEEMPSGVGDILTLQIIEVKFCSPFADNSARKIKKEQESMGNNQLKILIDNQECLARTYETESSESGPGEE